MKWKSFSLRAATETFDSIPVDFFPIRSPGLEVNFWDYNFFQFVIMIYQQIID